MTDFDTIIRNGTVVDGTGQVPGYRADVAIRNGKIAAIGAGIKGKATTELDASGCIVAPGAVEIHGHYDHQLPWDPYCTPTGWHGVTTVTIGTCGFGWAPCREEDRDAYVRLLSRVASIPPASLSKWLPWDWETFPQYLDSVDKLPKGLNVACMVPISPLRAYVMGAQEACSRTELTDAELQRMKALFREGMDAGAWGISLHRNPEDWREDGGPLPSMVASQSEMLALAEIIREYNIGSVYWTGGVEDEREFVRNLCRASGRPMNWTGVIQHKDEARDTWKSDLAWSEENLKLGLPMYAQAVPPVDMNFRLAECNLFDSIPAWKEPLLGTVEERIAKLKVPATRQAMKTDLDEGRGFFHGEWGQIFVTKTVEERNRKYEGQSVADIASAMGVHPVDAFLDLSIDEKLLTEFFEPHATGSNDDATEALITATSTHPAVSDGGAHYRFLSGGHWPTYVLAKWTRDKGSFTLEQAHYKLSALPAWIMGYRDRGILREGMAADIMVYELDRLGFSKQSPRNDTPTGDLRQIRTAEGYRYTLVNGEVTFENGTCTGAVPGRLIRSTEYTV